MFFNTLYFSLPEYIPPPPRPLGGTGVRKHRSTVKQYDYYIFNMWLQAIGNVAAAS
jgi:hypothetical protein